MFTTLDIIVTIYLVGTVICFQIVHSHLAKPETYRVIVSTVLAAIWPIPAALCTLLAIETALVWIKEQLFGNGEI
jgi:hypothetical protein